MTYVESASRWLAIWFTAPLVIVGVSKLPANETAAAPVGKLVATQRIRAVIADIPGRASLSHDGRLIAYVARGPRSVQRQCCQNVYVLDTSTGRVTQESVGIGGTAPSGDSQAPTLSSDGQVIAFETVASNLLSTNGPSAQLRIVVRDRKSGRTSTPPSAGSEYLDGVAFQPVVSGDGLSVFFTSDASNLTTGWDANGRQTDIYSWRLEGSVIAVVSVDTNNVQPSSGASHSPAVSRDGALVAFVSTARLVPEDTNSIADVYLRDVHRSTTVLISRGLDGQPADGASHSPALSADGRYVAFTSRAANLGARDRNHENDVYLHEVANGTTTLVSATFRGEAANAQSRGPAVSADGRYIVFQSVASNLGGVWGCAVSGSDTNLLPDVYLLDRTTRCISRISGSSTRYWWTPSIAPAIDGSGTHIVFSSTQPLNDDDLTTDFDLFGVVLPSTGADTGSRARLR